MEGSRRFEWGDRGGTRTAGLLLTKEVLADQLPEGAPLRSNTEAIANNRCLAALPSKHIPWHQARLAYRSTVGAASSPYLASFRREYSHAVGHGVMELATDRSSHFG